MLMGLAGTRMSKTQIGLGCCAPIALANPPNAVEPRALHRHEADLARGLRLADVVDTHAGAEILAALAEAITLKATHGTQVVVLVGHHRAEIQCLGHQQQVSVGLQVDGPGAGMVRQQIHDLRVPRIAHIHH